MLSDALIVLARLNRDQGRDEHGAGLFLQCSRPAGREQQPPASPISKFEIGKTYLQTGNLNLARNYLNAARQSHELGMTRSRSSTPCCCWESCTSSSRRRASPSCSWRTLSPWPTGLGTSGANSRSSRLLSVAYEQKGYLQQALESYKNYHQRSELVRQQQLALEQEAVRDNYAQVERVQQVRSWNSNSTSASTSRSDTSGPASAPGCCWHSSSICFSPSG